MNRPSLRLVKRYDINTDSVYWHAISRDVQEWPGDVTDKMELSADELDQLYVWKKRQIPQESGVGARRAD